MISSRMAIGPLLVVSLCLGFGCRSKPTRVLDRPSLPEIEGAKRAVSRTPLWEERTAPPSDGHYFVAASGDVNGDGIPDIAAGSYEPGGLSVWIGRADGTWQFHFVALPSSEVRDVLLTDLDRDGRDEILAISRGGIEGVLTLGAPKEGPWGQPDFISSASGYEALTAGDVNGDGYTDLAAARGGDDDSGGIDLWLGNDAGGFQGGFAPLSAGTFRDVLLADLDGDRNLDLVAAGWGLREGIRIFEGDGRGGFRAGPVVGAPGHYRGLVLEDVTGDGRRDLVATTYRAGVRIFPGLDPDTETCALVEEGSFWSPLVADADADGRPEIYVASTNGLGVPAWVHEDGCRFRRVETGLPDRDVWYGLSTGRVRAGGSIELIAAGFTGGIRVFAPSDSPRPDGGAGPLMSTAPDAAEEAWALGNDTFTMALGFPEYRLGVNDMVRVRLFNGTEVQEIEATVQSDGEIFVPARGIGSVRAAGVSPTQLKRSLLQLAGAVWREPDVEVVVTKYRSHRVSLLGEVRSTARVDSGPGHYPLEGKTRVVDFLSRHGGPTERADLNRVQLIRPPGRSSYLNLFKAIFASDQGENPILNHGDTVFVPSVALANRKVFVLGEVRQPGLLELRESITLLEAVARAEGLTDKAVLKNVLVIRGGLTSPELIAVNLRDMLEGGDMSSDIVLSNGDVVYVPRKVIANVKEVFSAIQPALNLIEDIFIIDALVNDD